MLKLLKHPDGPELPQEAKEKHFRSYVDMATWAEAHLPYGKYYCRSEAGTSFLTAFREIRYTAACFWVEGRGNV